MTASYDPAQIERVGEAALKVRWADGHESIYAWGYLRNACPCALCRERGLPMAVDPSIKPFELQPVGRYALSIRWSDGHKTGIFSHEYLRSICPCEECRPDQTIEG